MSPKVKPRVSVPLMHTQIRHTGSGTVSIEYDTSVSGLVTGATYDLYDPGGASLATGLSATLPPDHAPTSQLAPGGVVAGDTTIPVLDATGFKIGRTYLLLATDGAYEFVQVRSISGTTLSVQNALLATFNSLSTLSGYEIQCPIASTYTTDLGEGFECRVTYTVGGTDYIQSVYYDVVRSPWPEVILSPAGFSGYVGALSATELELVDGDQFSLEIADATDLVRLEILDRGHRPDLFRSHEGFRRPVAYRVLYEWARQGINVPRAWQSDPASWVEEARQRYDQSLSQALNTVRTYDADEDGVVTESEQKARLSSVRIRL